MKTNQELIGKEARLPDDQRVVIEEIMEGDRAVVRRLDGDRAGTVAICAVEKIRLLTS